MSVPTSLKHLAIVMDGNGRWARRKKHKRLFGHIKGAQTAEAIIFKCCDLKIPYLSLFTLSTENILRPETEIKALMDLFEKILFQKYHFLIEKNIRLHTIGDISFFSDRFQKQLQFLKEQTKNNTGLSLIIALNYGGRQEIVNGVRKMMEETQATKKDSNMITEEMFASFLPSSQFPHPDLIIRTGGDVRLSNFYLWSAAYSEFYFTEVLWPDFNEKELMLALKKYFTTHRKFGVL